MESREIFGFLGAACINISFIPQIWRLFKLRSAREISLPFTLLLIAGAIFWLIYGLLSSLPSVIIANSVALGLSILMLTAKLIYNKQSVYEKYS